MSTASRSSVTPGCANGASPTWRNRARRRPWLAEAPVHPLQQTLKDLERAYANFFAQRAAFPRFKKKGQGDSFRYPDPKQIKLDQANRRPLSA
jgi:putative transposase